MRWSSHAEEGKAYPYGPKGRGALQRPNGSLGSYRISPIRRPRRRLLCPEWRRIRTASGSGRRPDSDRNKTAWQPRSPACRRSGMVWPRAAPGAPRSPRDRAA